MTNKSYHIAIVDYGVGNFHSLEKILFQLDQKVRITKEPQEILESDAIILPGVGSFKSGVNGLKSRNLMEVIKEFSKKKPVLGICLGAQLLLSKGFEFGEYEGLNIIPGKVTKFSGLEKAKIPHMGWNGIYPLDNKKWSGTILNKIPKNSDVYFVHSYILEPDDKKDILALTNYGEKTFCSAVQRNNIYGCQFHPEKSGKIGLQIMNNFIKSLGI